MTTTAQNIRRHASVCLDTQCLHVCQLDLTHGRYLHIPTQSEEDRKLKDDLEVAVARVCAADEADGVKQLALEHLRNEIRTATSSMTSVPKPLKFLRPSYEPLKQAFAVRTCASASLQTHR